MRLYQDWHAALRAARRGDLGPARAARDAEPPSAPADYFYARCLAEAPAGLEPVQFAQAQALLQQAMAAQPANLLFMHAYILALARDERPEARRQAAALWRRMGLPHDADLLGQVALTIEMQLRPFNPAAPGAALPWPEDLPRPSEALPDAPLDAPPDPMKRDILSLAHASDAPAETLQGAPAAAQADPPLSATASPEATAAPPPPPPSLPALPRRRSIATREMRRMEKLLAKRRPLAAIELANALLGRGRGGAELHLLAGIAAEEADAPLLARAHLARAARLDPSSPFALAHLARVYWRLNRLDLALAVARGLPVEGPNDYGRHYLLALTHEALGDRPAALTAMAIVLREFFYDARHAYVSRALDRWVAAHAG